MKKISFLLLLFCSFAQADTIKCYNHGRLIYARHIHDISYADDVLVFVENKSSDVIFTNADCVIKIPTTK